ncbi:MAG TPA: transcriptional activator NhaR [Terriglobales bacterium]|nr:transcriptional activator NhaR [Terriglobales bacterium]
MEWLNYHHLFYFWTVAREGSIARASKELRLAQPTISGQIRALEEWAGGKVFQRVGRNLVMTELGRLLYRYAEDIFTLGRELTDTVRDRPTGRPLRFVVGVADVLPKLIVYRLLEPALRMGQQIRMICREDSSDHLVAQLALHELDLVLSDASISPTVNVRGYSHLLGECGITFFAAPRLATKLRRRFPESLNGAPFLMPGEQTLARRSLEQWLEREGIRPNVTGEFKDRALLEVFGEAGVGAFAAPTVIETNVCKKYGVQVIGRLGTVREQFFAITGERKLVHPAAVAISESARTELFAMKALA